MIDLGQLLLPGLFVVGIVFCVLVSYLLSAWHTGRAVSELRDELTRARRLIDQALADLRGERRPAGSGFGERRPAGDDFGERRPPAGDDWGARRPPRAPALPPEPGTERPPAESRSAAAPPATRLEDAAAAALADRNAFRAFVETHGGRGYVLRPEETPVPAGQGAEFTADLWAVDGPEGRLVFPGYNLRRTQSSLVADSGRPAEARLGWLFKIEAGHTLRATRPALVGPSDWSVLRPGYLQIPF